MSSGPQLSLIEVKWTIPQNHKVQSFNNTLKMDTWPEK